MTIYYIKFNDDTTMDSFTTDVNYRVPNDVEYDDEINQSWNPELQDIFYNSGFFAIQDKDFETKSNERFAEKSTRPQEFNIPPSQVNSNRINDLELIIKTYTE